MPKVILKGYIIVPESDYTAVKRELVNHKKLTQEEPGCLIFDVAENSEHSLRFDVYEEFVDKRAFEYHQKRVSSSYWGKITVNVERNYDVCTGDYNDH